MFIDVAIEYQLAQSDSQIGCYKTSAVYRANFLIGKVLEIVRCYRKDKKSSVCRR